MPKSLQSFCDIIQVKGDNTCKVHYRTKECGNSYCNEYTLRNNNSLHVCNLPGDPRLLKLAENEKELLDVEQPEK